MPSIPSHFRSRSSCDHFLHVSRTDLSYGNETLPTGAEARDEPFAAFPSWFLRIECDRCGKDRMVNESHVARSSPA